MEGRDAERVEESYELVIKICCSCYGTQLRVVSDIWLHKSLHIPQVSKAGHNQRRPYAKMLKLRQPSVLAKPVEHRRESGARAPLHVASNDLQADVVRVVNNINTPTRTTVHMLLHMLL